MNNVGATVLKVTMLAGGAVIGALLARLVDEALTKSSEERSAHDKNRYAQGLAPVQPDPQKEKYIPPAFD